MIKPQTTASPEAITDYQNRLCCITSHPRSGSHWLRRMLGEVVANRIGYDLNFSNIDRFIGFNIVPINNVFVAQHTLPIFFATHAYEDKPRIFLRRNFQDVLASCWKAEDDNQEHWFTGNEREVHERWLEMTTFGCSHAELVIDYDMMKQEPKAVLSSIFKHLGHEVANRELDQALIAGSRENMLKEQQQCEKRTWDIVNELNY